MNTQSYFAKIRFGLFKFFGPKKSTKTQITDGLVPSEFEIKTLEKSIKKKEADSSLFLMYSKENETLFI